MEAATRNILLSNQAVKALVDDRVSCGTADQNERRPRLVLSLVERKLIHTTSAAAGYASGKIKVDCLAGDYATAKALAQAVTDALDGYEGVVSGADGLDVQFLILDTEADLPPDVPEGAGQPATYGVSVVFRFMINI